MSGEPAFNSVVSPNDDPVLLRSRFGSVDGGTCTLAAPYEGSIWDRVRAGGLVTVPAEIVLTTAHLSVNRFIGQSYRIPIDQILAVYTGRAIGGRYWGRGSVLKVVWQSDGAYRCTWLMLGRGRNVAMEWAKQLTPLLRADLTRAAQTALSREVDGHRLQSQNRRTAWLAFSVITLSLVVLVIVAWVFW